MNGEFVEWSEKALIAMQEFNKINSDEHIKIADSILGLGKTIKKVIMLFSTITFGLLILSFINIYIHLYT